MEPFYTDGITIITLSTIILECLGMTLKLLSKSNFILSQVSVCFGLCNIHREVQLETDIIHAIPVPTNTNVV